MQLTDVIAFWQTGKQTPQIAESGLRSVGDLDRKPVIPSDERALLEKAKAYGASHVFFRCREGRTRVAEALVFDDASPTNTRTDDDFARLHRQLWSWGAVPLVYRRLHGRVDMFRCGHRPDFDTGRKEPEYRFNDFIHTAGDITRRLEEKPWWDLRRLANGTLWDDQTVAQRFLSENSAHKTILRNVEFLDKQLKKESRIPGNLRRRLLIISLLVAYLEDRDVFKLEADFFSKFKPGAQKFFHVLSDAESLIKLLGYLETERFNGNVFVLDHEEKQELRQTSHLKKFAELIEGGTESGGQQVLWRLYSFHDLPVELISHIYQLFVEDKTTCVYTPPFLARLMLEEALTLERMDRLEERSEVVFDPACGSGVFLVEAFKRLVLHWRKNNNWDKPPVDVLRTLMKRVRGTDIDGSAVELAAFSLCLAMCEELEPPVIWRTGKLFPPLREKTLFKACFFQQAREHKLPRNIGVIVGNPPFGSASDKGTTAQAYDEYQAEFGKQSLPDKQSAYLFLHHGMEALAEGGLLCLLQKDNFLYNRRSVAFRRSIFNRWAVREILDFTPIRGLFLKDPKVVVVVAEAQSPNPPRPILHAIFRRTAHTQAELSFELDYYDMQWVSHDVALTKDFVWRSNLFGGGRAVSLVERLKQFPTLKDYIKQHGWDYGEGYMVGSPSSFSAADITDLTSLAEKLRAKLSPISTYLFEYFNESEAKQLAATRFSSANALQLKNILVKNLNKAIACMPIYNQDRFKSVVLRSETQKLLGEKPQGEHLACLNRQLLEDAYPQELSKIAIVEYLYQQPFIPAKAIRADGTVEKKLICKQVEKYFQWPRPKSRYMPPLILIDQTDEPSIAYWDDGPLTYGQEVLGIACAGGNKAAHRAFYSRLSNQRFFLRAWLSLTSARAGIQKATALQKKDVDELPFPESEASLDLSLNDEIILNDAFDYYRDFQRLGDDADMMRQAQPDDHREFATVYTRQINTVHKKLRSLPPRTWAGICCQPFVFGKAEPDWTDTDSLAEKLAVVLRSKKSVTLTTVRILRIFDGPFVFLIKPDRLRYWLRSIALRDADESLADLRRMGF